MFWGVVGGARAAEEEEEVVVVGWESCPEEHVVVRWTAQFKYTT